MAVVYFCDPRKRKRLSRLIKETSAGIIDRISEKALKFTMVKTSVLLGLWQNSIL